MTDEERRRKLKEDLKAQYKKDLQMRKDFLNKAKNLRHTKKINDSLSDMLSGLEDDSDDWIAELNKDSALTEAKLDMMLDSASDMSKEIEKMAKEAQNRKFEAEDLVRQMKIEMGLIPAEEPPAKPAPKEGEEPSTEASDKKEEAEGSAEETAPKEEEKPKRKPPKKSLGDI